MSEHCACTHWCRWSALPSRRRARSLAVGPHTNRTALAPSSRHSACDSGCSQGGVDETPSLCARFDRIDDDGALFSRCCCLATRGSFPSLRCCRLAAALTHCGQLSEHCSQAESECPRAR